MLLVHERAGKKKGEELIIPASNFIICDSASLPPSIVTSIAPSPQGSASVSPISHSNSHSPAIYKLSLSVLPDFDPEVEEDGSFSCASVLCVPARKRTHPAGGATFSSTTSLVKLHQASLQASSQLKAVMSAEKFKLGFDTTLAMPLSRKRTAATAAAIAPSTICFTYSEITMASFRAILATLTSSGQDEFYRLGEQSTFLDIGHGLGACVYTTALDIGCTARGIEYAQNKFELSK